MLLSRCKLSPSLTPKSRTLRPADVDCMSCFIGAALRQSVDQRNRLDGGGYPRPITFTKYLFSRFGETTLVYIGRLCSLASWVRFCNVEVANWCTTGISTPVSQ